MAALEGVEWGWDGPTSTASPGTWTSKLQPQLAAVRAKLLQLRQQQHQQANAGPAQSVDKQIESLARAAVGLETQISEGKLKARGALYQRVAVLQRFHFSSKLQRMSVLCSCGDEADIVKSTQSPTVLYSLVKGSPEAIKSLLRPESTPDWYDKCYEGMARRGLRVLALAYKRILTLPQECTVPLHSGPPFKQNSTIGGIISVSSMRTDGLSINVNSIPRTFVESELEFGGFIAFECRVRGDSSIVIQSLLQSKHIVVMVTGDALLTSLHVAREVGIVPRGRSVLTLVHSEVNGKQSIANSIHSAIVIFEFM